MTTVIISFLLQVGFSKDLAECKETYVKCKADHVSNVGSQCAQDRTACEKEIKEMMKDGPVKPK